MHLIRRTGSRTSRGAPVAPRAARGPRNRGGFTLLELLVTLILLSAVMGSLLTVLVRQQRFYRSTSDIIDARSSVRQTADLLPADLRTISSSDRRNGTDFYVATDKAIEFRAITGTSVICQIQNGTKITLPPANSSRGNHLTTWSTPPIAGDSVLVYDDSSAAGHIDDHWGVFAVTSVGTIAPGGSNACPTTSGFVTAADVTAGRLTYQLNLPASPLIPTTINVGAPVKIFHTRRYELYQPSSSSGWYLGSCEYASPCTTLSPVSGPYAAYDATAANSGLSFTYFDSLGTEFTPAATAASRARIWRIRLRARADTRAPISIPGRQVALHRDSLSIDITLRNRR